MGKGREPENAGRRCVWLWTVNSFKNCLPDMLVSGSLEIDSDGDFDTKSVHDEIEVCREQVKAILGADVEMRLRKPNRAIKLRIEVLPDDYEPNI